MAGPELPVLRGERVVRRDLLAPQDDEVVLAIEVEGEVAGVLMVGEEVEPDYAARDRLHDRGARPLSLLDRPGS
jgi:hypothetical protein